MSRDSDVFAATLAIAILEADEQAIQAMVVQDMLDRIDTAGGLAPQLAVASKTERSAGNFGMEMIGPILIPILIEAGKSLWAAYAKKLTDKAADQLANLTVSKAKSLAEQLWDGDKQLEARAAYEGRVKELAAAQGIAPDHIEGLVKAIRSENTLAFLSDPRKNPA